MKVYRSIKIPDKVTAGDPVKAIDHNALIEALIYCLRELESTRVASSADIGVRRTGSGGQTLFIKKSGSGTTVPESCSFGQIVNTPDSDPPTKSIRGGLLVCGDKNFNVPDKVLDTADGEWLIELSLSGIDPATDDDDEIFLSGVITASGEPTWGNTAVADGYTDTTNPPDPSGTGTAIIGLGILRITDGSPSFIPTGCGTITIGQCAGILSHSRG